jgi:hypothetical protein
MLRARKIVRASKTEQERDAVADHVVRQLKVRGYPLRLDDEAKSAPPTHDLACGRCENGDPVANYGHFGGIVLSEDLGRGSDR